MAETLHRSRMSSRESYRLYMLMTQVDHPVATWTSPFLRAQEALRIAGDAMELQDSEVARYAIKVHLRFMRVLLAQFGREEAAALGRDAAQVQAMIGAALEDGAADFGGPKVDLSLQEGFIPPGKPVPLGSVMAFHDGPHGTELGSDLDRMGGERLF